MTYMAGNKGNEQTIEVPLEVGSRVTLLTDVDIDESGSAGAITFVGVVERYVPKTGKLSFEDKDIGRAEFRTLLDEAEVIEIYKE